jgi:hypothetical protein
MVNTPAWKYFRFALLVTGKGEEQFLSKLFRSLEAEGDCTFKVDRRVKQLRPITSLKKQKITGTDLELPRKDEDIGLVARGCFSKGFDYVILVDDLEHDWTKLFDETFRRYREALDRLLRPQGTQAKASVHFFVNMLEAYYLADSAAINAVLGTALDDYEGDVETIRHPKNDLKKINPGFHEVRHGRLILERLDLPHILSNPATCASLRTLIAWCSRAIGRPLSEKYELAGGCYCDVAKHQIDTLPEVR